MDVTRRLAKKDDRSSSKSTNADPQEPNQISVIFQRDEKGYGLTVCGDNPVFVQVVTEDGPAEAAGLQPGDRIVRVNGAFVTKSNHLEVVRLIKSTPWVAMTVVRTPFVKDSTSKLLNGNGQENSNFSNKTGPLRDARLISLSRHLDEELEVLRNHQKEFQANPSEQLQMALDRVNKNVKFYQDEISAMEHSIKCATPSSGKVGGGRTEDSRGAEKPPTPPPIERIPRHHDDSSSQGSPRSCGNINRRRSNPEAMHLGISRMALASSLPDQSGNLNRSASTVNVKNESHPNPNTHTIPDDIPPALPAKRARQRNPIGDSTDMGTPSGSPPPPYPDLALMAKANGHKVPKSGSFSGSSIHGASRIQPVRMGL